MCLGCDGVVCSCGTSVGLVGRGIGGGTGGGGGCVWVGGQCVFMFCGVLWLEGWREVPVVCLSVSCCVCCLFGVHVVVAWSMIVVTV